ncbi:hypothetical protein HHO41_14505 [Bacillus sp. DNRA2]|uniref:hypothetical protein n=1 Tax=Bacillus sp. DNRA2 TaxID=2723053 RepID=UPI00145F7CA3|nr:hypothetical protein [Bacillus sp. DNRA2]NMD71514.1 hypothetical protein [Bacillus sp. DNRA2]
MSTKHKFIFPSMVIAFAVVFGYHLLALLNLVPLYVTSPLLFITLFLIVTYLNNRKKFKGF